MSSSSDLNSASPLTPTQQRGNRLYLVPILTLPLAMLLAAFFIVPTHWFAMRSGSSYIANVGYADTLHNRVCDILIYGDSTAMVGIDPAILHERTGLSACNIAEYAGITLINDMVLVDDFLANNPRPRFIVFMYAPNSLNRPHSWNTQVSTLEGISYLIDRQPPARAAFLLASHPAESISWAEAGMRIALGHIRSRPFPESTTHLREANNGRFPTPQSVRDVCESGAGYRIPPDPAWILALRAEYGKDGTQVLVDATPTAPCDPNLSFFQEHLNPVIDNKPYQTIPLSAFSNEGHLHMNHQGVNLVSDMIASQINALTRPAGGN